MLLGRNNYGLNIHYFAPERFASARETKRQLRKICGRKYPVSVKALMKRLKKGNHEQVMLALNSRGTKKFASVRGDSHYDTITKDHWCVGLGNPPSRLVWGWMKDHYNIDFKMKEPTK